MILKNLPVERKENNNNDTKTGWCPTLVIRLHMHSLPTYMVHFVFHTLRTTKGAQTSALRHQARDMKRKWSQETGFCCFRAVGRFVPFTEPPDKQHKSGILAMIGSLHSINLCKICRLHRHQWLAEQNRGKIDTIT